jgi:glycosyltransferase involved in cell wall biosynthesis
VIARRLGPFPEIVAQSGGGELFGTEAELLEAMCKLQADEGYRQRLAESGYRASIDLWSESAVVPRYLEVVERSRK